MLYWDISPYVMGDDYKHIGTKSRHNIFVVDAFREDIQLRLSWMPLVALLVLLKNFRRRPKRLEFASGYRIDSKDPSNWGFSDVVFD